jgi:hypothetical protein
MKLFDFGTETLERLGLVVNHGLRRKTLQWSNRGGFTDFVGAFVGAQEDELL